MTVPVRLTKTPFTLDVAEGNVNGTSYAHIFGFNDAIDIASGFETVGTTGGTYTGLDATAAETVEVFSDDVNDTAAGTGARTVRVVGLDENWLEVQEDVTLNGTTPVTTTTTFIRSYLSYVLTAGSGGENAGNITIRQSTTTANVFGLMMPGYNRSLVAAYSVPANKQAFLYNVFASTANKTLGTITVRAKFRPFGSVFNVLGVVSLHADGTSFAQLEYNTPSGPLPPKSDYFLEADTSANNMGVAAGFELLVRST